MSLPVKKNLRGRRAVVLGSEPAALVAAVSLAIRGGNVLLVTPEKEDEILQQSGKSYFFPTFTQPHLLAELFADANLRISDFLDLKKERRLLTLMVDEGQSLSFFGDESAMLDQTGDLPSAEKNYIQNYIAKSKRKYRQKQKFVRRYLRSPKVATILLSTAEWLSRLNLLLFLGIRKKRTNGGVYPKAFHALSLLQARFGECYNADTMAMLGEVIEDGGWRIPENGTSLHAALFRLCDLVKIKRVHGVKLKKIELNNKRVKRVVFANGKSIPASLVAFCKPKARLEATIVNKGEELEKFLKNMKPLQQGFLEVIFRAQSIPEGTSRQIIIPSDLPGEETRFVTKWQVPYVRPTMVLSISRSSEGWLLVKVRMPVPLEETKFRWSERKKEAEINQIVTRLEKYGFKLEKVIDSTFVPCELFGLKRRVKWEHPVMDIRCQGANGLYLLPYGDRSMGDLASQVMAGMAAGYCASKDAGD